MPFSIGGWIVATGFDGACRLLLVVAGGACGGCCCCGAGEGSDEGPLLRWVAEGTKINENSCKFYRILNVKPCVVADCWPSGIARRALTASR